MLRTPSRSHCTSPSSSSRPLGSNPTPDRHAGADRPEDARHHATAAGDEHWVDDRFESNHTADLEFASASGSGVISYRLSAEPHIEFAADWIGDTLSRWTVTQDGRPLGKDGKPRDPYGRSA